MISSRLGLALPVTSLTPDKFNQTLQRVLRRSLGDKELSAFLQKGEGARFVEDTHLDGEDLVYLWEDLTKAFSLRLPSKETPPRFWRLSMFRSELSTPFEISDFSVADLRRMAEAKRWLPDILT